VEKSLSIVLQKKSNIIHAIFGKEKAIIGVVHCSPLPGSPRNKDIDFKSTLQKALDDARAYADGGVDGLIIENHGDIPFLRPHDIGPETSAALAVIVDRVAQALDLPLGVNVLANAVIPALAVAKAGGARFVRVNQWANAYVANEGFVEGDAARALRYRAQIGAEHVAIFADAHVKHGAHAITADRSIAELARDVEFFDADAVIATGQRTGDAASVDEIQAIRSGSSLPLIVGSGVTIDNVETILPLVDAVIIASALKRDGVWWNEVEKARVSAFMRKAREIRERSAGTEGPHR
jgi:membrane complex biogenesis BtpA family protein